MAKNVLDGIAKAVRKGSDIEINLLSDDSSPCVVQGWLSTGCEALDHVMGGGLPRGRIVEMFGDESTGKSLIAAQCAAVAQSEGVHVVYIDTESAVSITIMSAVGVDTSKILYVSPNTIEEVFTIIEKSIDAKTALDVDSSILVIWDTVAATSTEREMNNPFGKASMGNHAQIMSASLRKITRKISKQNVYMLFLNQTRSKIGVMFGDNTTTSGGKAVAFYSSIRVHIRKMGKIKEGKRVIGAVSVAVVEKNKVAPPYLQARLPVYFGHGIDDYEATFMYLKDSGAMTAAGSSYTIDGLPQLGKFGKKKWNDLYEKHFEAIVEYMHDQVVDLQGEMKDAAEDSDDSSD
jgi:recombination protein RecA